jgi:hypothetical protein
MKPAIEVLDIRPEELNAQLEHARAALGEEDYRQLKAVVEGLIYLTELIADRGHNQPRSSPVAVPAGDGEDAGDPEASGYRRCLEASRCGGGEHRQ